MEIYNERIYDLLVDVSNPEVGAEYTIIEEKDGRGVVVRGLTEMEVKDEASALNLLFTGGLSRTMATHKLNKRSNRSHSIFTLYCQQRQRSGVSERIIHSKLHLIDLAGSERLKKTMDGHMMNSNDEVTKKESMAINRSLTYLEQCVVALTRKGQTHIPYRQSKLTNIMKDCLGANCNTVMIACIWGEANHLEETVSTLRLASRMNHVINESSTIESTDPTILLKKQEKLIKALKQELLMHDALVERTGMIYDAYTPEQQQSISQMIEKYIIAPEKEEEEILKIETFREMLEICKQFKKKVLDARHQSTLLGNNNNTQTMGMTIDGLGGVGGGVGSAGGVGLGGLGHNNNHNNVLDSSATQGGWLGSMGTIREVGGSAGGVVGKGDNGSGLGGGGRGGGGANNRGAGGFSLGEARMDARPLNGIETAAHFIPPPRSPPGIGQGSSGTSMLGSPNLKYNNKNNNNSSPNNRNISRSPDKLDSLLLSSQQQQSHSPSNHHTQQNVTHLQAFLQSDANIDQIFQQYQQHLQQLKNDKQQIREFITQINHYKQEIDRYNLLIAQRKSHPPPNATSHNNNKAVTIDHEEIKLIEELKENKKKYREEYEQLQRLQSSYQQLNNESDVEKHQLSSLYQQWMNSGGPRTLPNNNNNNLFSEEDDPNHTTNNNNNNDNNVGGSFDELDDQEAFDRLEQERVMSNDPDALAFFTAQKTKRANLTQSGGNIKMIQRTKRFT
jgi:kinesin family member 6/9